MYGTVTAPCSSQEHNLEVQETKVSKDTQTKKLAMKGPRRAGGFLEPHRKAAHPIRGKSKLNHKEGSKGRRRQRKRGSK
jgi:hypothetical protein